MIRSQIIAGTVCLLSLFAAGAAHAEDSPTAGHASAAVLLGDGFKDGYGLGFGVRGGYTLPMNVYIGGTFVYHLGKSESTAFGDEKFNIYYFGVEGGYDLAAGPLVVRPYLGLGDATATASIGGISASDSKLALWPGATALFPIGPLSVGADVRYVIVTGSSSTDANGNSSSANAFSLFATAAYQF
jgi:hypothetical protein